MKAHTLSRTKTTLGFVGGYSLLKPKIASVARSEKLGCASGSSSFKSKTIISPSMNLGCACGSSSPKLKTTTMPFENLGIPNTLVNPIAQTLSVEGRDWIFWVPRSSPSKKLMNMKGQVGLKSLFKFGDVFGQTGQVVD